MLKANGIAILFLLFTACSKLINDEFPDFEPLPNVNTVLIAGEPVVVHVSMAEKIDTTFLTFVDDADLILSNGDGLSQTLEYDEDGLYISGIVAMPGESYTCTINMDGYNEMYAQDTVPLITEISITDHTSQARYDEEGIFMEGIEFQFRDDPSTHDYYEVALYKQMRENAYSVYPFNEHSEILLNEGLEPYSTETLVFSDQLITDSIVTMFLDFHQGSYGMQCWDEDSCFLNFDAHTLILEFRHTSREYYQYKKHFYLYEKNRYPYFVEGTATAFSFYSNVENATGIMASYSGSTDSIFVEEVKIPMF